MGLFGQSQRLQNKSKVDTFVKICISFWAVVKVLLTKHMQIFRITVFYIGLQNYIIKLLS